VSYVAVGPVFGTSTKDTGYGAVGVELVAAAARLAGPIPIVVIGGITLDNARSALDAGAAAVAVISDLLTGGDPATRVRDYVRALT
jgi:thiamine-phosphate pyrophosphorylase